ncbi:hypothetical protein CC1G_01724 [Coprinopsis cinerea okayama7|uniref:Sec39 domain-containing protein n=1 Tax=Coprinopsis cinerea (strain Okayama-7 / 130 / ATCC MYA-4618 / FGSC 9003) TaxID=240176 RepID=A8N2K7_COPC7|nr:hypothetical protein CC1G_01724 [Coprinopsis cinerea okayama7\|eukprot:XP_001829044.1 hypothetical protein CC1G_01724 [Coprinopsis cinerea okayama7\
MAESSTSPYTTWESTADHEITPELVFSLLSPIPDDVWTAAACVDRTLDDTTSQQSLLIHGIARTDKAAQRCAEVKSRPTSVDVQQSQHDILRQHFQSNHGDAQLVQLRSILLRRLDRLNTYVEMEKVSAGVEEENVVEDEIEEWEDDPWADSETSSTKPTPKTKSVAKLPLTLSEFLLNDLVTSAQNLATQQFFDAIQLMFKKHRSELWPSRFAILDAIPEHAVPSSYRHLLPGLDNATNLELVWPQEPWRPEPDVSEQSEIRSVLREIEVGFNELVLTNDLPVITEPLEAEALRKWYSNQVDVIIQATGIVDAALAIVQHGASQGIPGLDELGEELSLLSRLVYDTPQAQFTNDDWTVSRWRSMSPESVVRAYLAHSPPESLPQDISSLVMPYLYVLEARAERAGSPDPDLPNRLLYDYILSIPLEHAAAVFEASKPTLPASQRVLRDDEDVARLALACLYGSESLSEWPTMSRIFECMPAWDTVDEGETDEEAADTTIRALGNFVAPSTSRTSCAPKDLLTFFKPLSIQALSRALDILDVHLESGEILSRWSVPAPLRWFLRSHDDVNEQRAWANRMARRAGGSVDPLTTMEDWEWLLEDMLKLTESNESGLRGAFGLLARDEVLSIYFSGLLSTGKFDIAKAMLRGSHPKISLSPEVVEDICLKCSRELYDNASSGNYKIGDMKLAYDCLDVPPLSDQIQLEKEFIEATSRICSFNVISRAGVPISPIEIRLTKDRLSLVSQVLSSNSDAYKHTEVMLDLTYKLGFRDDVSATVKVLAMLAETALQMEDFTRAFECTQRMVAIIHDLQTTQSLLSDDSKLREAVEVCWIACFQLGRQPEYPSLDNKMKLLGQALDLCPTDRMHDVLTAWRRMQKEDIERREERLNSQQSDIIQTARPAAGTSFIPRTVASSLRARLHDLHMPSPPLLSTPDAAALATKTFKTVASNFPFALHRSHSAASDDRSAGRSEASWRDVEVSSQASRALSKGIGWLIGADDE